MLISGLDIVDNNDFMHFRPFVIVFVFVLFFYFSYGLVKELDVNYAVDSPPVAVVF